MTKIEGGCLCGAVRFKAEVAEPSVMSCYCKDCQHATGSSCATFVAVPETAFELEGDPRSYTTQGEESGKDVTRYFCAHCGSQLYSAVEIVPGLFFVKLGTLTDCDELVPRAHIWTRSKPAWVELPAGVPAFEKSPQR